MSRILRQFENSNNFQLVVENQPHSFAGQAPASCYAEPINWGGIAQHYGLVLDEAGQANREKVAHVVTTADDICRGHPVVIRWITSYDVVAYRQQRLPNVCLASASVSVITLTADDQLVLGLRGGELTMRGMQEFGRGRWAVVPSGHLSWKEECPTNLAAQIAVAEFRQELSSHGGLEVVPLGITEVDGPRFPGIKFVFLLRTHFTLRDLQEIHERAARVYHHHTECGDPLSEVKHTLRHRGLPVDVWEHDLLKGLSNTRAVIEEALRSLDLIEPSRLALELYLQSL